MNIATPNTAARREAAGYVVRSREFSVCSHCQNAGSIKRPGAPTLWHCKQHNFAIRSKARCNAFEATS